MRKYKHIWMKVILVVLAETVAMLVNHGFSTFVHPIENTMRANVVSGAILAVVVVWLYNYRVKKKKQRLEEELKDLTDVVLKNIPDSKDDNRRE
jgi:hypothetical protein